MLRGWPHAASKSVASSDGSGPATSSALRRACARGRSKRISSVSSHPWYTTLVTSSGGFADRSCSSAAVVGAGSRATVGSAPSAAHSSRWRLTASMCCAAGLPNAIRQTHQEIGLNPLVCGCAARARGQASVALLRAGGLAFRVAARRVGTTSQQQVYHAQIATHGSAHERCAHE